VQIKFPDRDAQGMDHWCMVMVVKTTNLAHEHIFYSSMLLACIQEVPSLILARTLPFLTGFFVVFLSTFKQVLE
jgi:hypothetical protein